MLQLENCTPFAADMSMFANEQAIDTLYIIVKATFNINAKLSLADVQTTPIAADEYWTEPGKSSIKYASDYHTGKQYSDVVMLGHAFAPMDKTTTQLDVSLSVGQVQKTVRVFGNRYWDNGRITAPEPFKNMAMVYEKAFGGMVIKEGKVAETETRNPLGRGFAGSRTTTEMNGMPLPNLEDPAQLITHPEQTPAPACFGVSAAHWHPRATFAGTYDDVWQTTRAPYLPEDFDKRFYNVAHPDLVYPGYLQGGEPVQITNMHPKGNIKFTVPRVNVFSDVSIDNKIVRPTFNIETLIIEPNKLSFSMLWRASLQCDKAMLKISKIKINLQK